MKRSGPLMSRLAWLLVALGAVLLLLGFLSPRWIGATGSRDDELRFGLWRACVKDMRTNASTCTRSNQYMSQDWNEEWLPGVQCMMCIALLSSLLSLAAHAFYMLPLAAFESRHTAAIFVALNASFTTSVLLFLCVLVLGIQQANDEVNFAHTTLHWGFAVTVLALCLFVATWVLLLLEFYEILFNNSYIKAQLSLHRKKLAKVLEEDIMNSKMAAMYQDPEDNPDFASPSGVARGDKRRLRHDYDNNIATREGFRIYDNAVPRQHQEVIVEQHENEAFVPDVVIDSVSASGDKEMDKSVAKSEIGENQTIAEVEEYVSRAGSIQRKGTSVKSRSPSQRSNVPVHLFRASMKSNHSNIPDNTESVRTKSVKSTRASAKSTNLNKTENLDESESVLPADSGHIDQSNNVDLSTSNEQSHGNSTDITDDLPPTDDPLTSTDTIQKTTETPTDVLQDNTIETDHKTDLDSTEMDENAANVISEQVPAGDTITTLDVSYKEVDHTEMKQPDDKTQQGDL